MNARQTVATLGVLLCSFLSNNAFATDLKCDTIYKKKIEVLQTTKSVGGVALGALMIGAVVNPLPGFAGTAIVGGASAGGSSVLALVSTGGAAVTGATTLVIDGVKYISAGGLRKAVELFNQADSGDGLELRAFRDEVNESAKSDLSLSEIITLLNTGRDGAFCPKDILTVEEIAKLVARQAGDR
jgi:hypothetical protein